MTFAEIEVTYFSYIFSEVKQFMHNLHCLRPRLERKFNPEAYSLYTTSRPYYDIDRQDFYDDPDDTDSMGNQAFTKRKSCILHKVFSSPYNQFASVKEYIC